MASIFRIVRGSGLRTLNFFSRPKSSFTGVNPTLNKKSSILFSQPRVQTQVLAQQNQGRSMFGQILRNQSTSTSHSASKHWTIERYLATGLIGLIPAGLLFDSKIIDYLLAAGLTLHSHWGLECIATDYIHGALLPKLAFAALYMISALSFIGLCYFNYSDIGITKAIKKIWSL